MLWAGPLVRSPSHGIEKHWANPFSNCAACRLVRPLDLGCLDDDHHDRDDKVYMQAGERDGSACEPWSPGFRSAPPTPFPETNLDDCVRYTKKTTYFSIGVIASCEVALGYPILLLCTMGVSFWHRARCYTLNRCRIQEILDLWDPFRTLTITK